MRQNKNYISLVNSNKDCEEYTLYLWHRVVMHSGKILRWKLLSPAQKYNYPLPNLQGPVVFKTLLPISK